jgi:hypothetical protein
VIRPKTRQLLVLVALAGVVLALVAWVERRRGVFESEASRHLEMWLVQVGDDSHGGSPRADYHRSYAVGANLYRGRDR